MSETARAVHATAPVERRAAAIVAALEAQGWKAGEFQWPAPHRISSPPLASYGYERELYLSAPIEVPRNARVGSTARIAGRITWVVCDDECIADGFNQERPDGVPRNSGEKTSRAEIDAARADLGLGPYTGDLEEPDFFQVDLRISRAFGDGPRSLETFVQVFNLLDRDNLGLVDGVVGSPTFGQPLTIVGPPRTIELGLRFGF